MKKLVYSCLFFLLININNLFPIDLLSGKISSYEGLHFYVGFMENESNLADPQKYLEQKIFLTSNQNANVTLLLGTNNQLNVFIPANEVVDVDVSASYENNQSEEIRKSLIEVNSDVPISVYAYSSIPRSTDSYAVIPIANWGKEYFAVSLPNDQYNKVTLDSIKDFTPRSSQFMIMAAYDETVVTIIPKSLTRKAKQVDKEYYVTLNKGECYLVQSWQYFRGEGDLSGSIVRANKPVGMLSGHVRTALLQGFVEQPPDSKDHLIEMLPPTSAWGKNYISTPFGTSPSRGDYFKVIAKDPNTKLDIYTGTGVIQFQFSAGDNIKVVQGLTSPAQWIATGPIQIAQFMYRTNDTLESDYYDPSMVILPPIEQFVTKIIFQTPSEIFQYVNGEKFISHYVNVVADEASLNTLRLDANLVRGISNIAQQKITGTGLYWAKLRVAPGKHILKTDSGRFSGIIYGIGRFDSYAMALGSSLENPFVDDQIPPTVTFVDSCYCINGLITDEISEKSYGIYYAYIDKEKTNNFDISFSSFAPEITSITFKACPNDIYKDGTFSIIYLDKYGNTREFDYFHNAVKLLYSPDYILGSLNWKDSVCYNYSIKNEGKSSQLVNPPIISGDTRFKLYSDKSFPYMLAPDEDLTIRICVSAQGDTSNLSGNLFLDFGCNIKDTIPVFAEVIALELEILPHDFGEVMIGDTVCDYVYVINNSNISVILTSSDFVLTNLPFSVDTTGLFPYSLMPGDTLNVPVCYFPIARVRSNAKIDVNNIYNLNLSTVVKGKGVAPSIASVELDWGKRRIGTINDSSLTFSNTGNIQGYLTFLNFLSKTNDDNNTSKLQNLSNLLVEVGIDTKLDFSYIPSNIGGYLVEAELLTNWKLHQNVLLILKGVGTIPVINTIDVNFPDTDIYSTKDTLTAILKNTGNETLYIDSIFPKSGDINSFQIDFDLLKKIYIKPDSVLTIDITFSPTSAGNHKLILGVINDANPNFELSEANLTISGNGIPPTSSDIEILFVTKQTFICLLDTAEVVIKNKGNINVDLTNLQIEKSPDNFRAEVLDFSPTIITPGEEKSYKILIFAEKAQGGRVKAIFTFFDNFTRSAEYDFSPQISTLDIKLDDQVRYSVGDTLAVILRGEYPQKTDIDVNFYLKMEIRNDYLYLLEVPEKVSIQQPSGNIDYPLSLNKSSEFIELTTDEVIKLDSKASWEIELKFMALLSPTKDSSWNLSFTSDKCFEPISKNLSSKLNDICVYNIRGIGWITDIFMANIYPNPIKNEINLKVVMSEDNTLEVEIYNEIGIKFQENKFFPLKKGIHFVSFDVWDLPNGLYFLKIKNNTEINSIKFVKIN